MSSTQTPRFPRPLANLLKRVPAFLPGKTFALLINRFLAQPLQEGELDFLEDKVLNIQVSDTGIQFSLTLEQNRLVATQQAADVSIQGSLYAFLLLAGRHEDPDTLFFNRSLRLEGDTELGLYVKNFLDALEFDGELARLLPLLEKAAPKYATLSRLPLPAFLR
ncbi:ubiquinone anaerobic biosynthesis accessory factor UbiT [Candidatus Venteria ishoeyi]|uniref:Ubiquinone biosynthesis accessory factor UbiT n=1 Tax=Candidatus Venteria ishoeyi TaxID=1899563 RepID=A0A1H6F9T8_9GAMM|nr:SCP2 sterol-binding domain-containing protein [Candidatus Venteria ishoeyi]MDM8547613.1 SCP2 sterol-binding domain-containing protein [Candidatus Venteria ishoeyi]SEH06141.1 SCP-2 sterol transfer family protein [Candidatus Venteria ishoeyi]